MTSSSTRPTVDIPRAAWLSADDRVALDLPCVICDYNLRDQPIDTHCPECGGMVWRSAGPAALRFRPVEWLIAVRWGIALLLVSLLGSYVGDRLGEYFPQRMPALGARVPALTWWQEFRFLLVGELSAALGFVGIWLITTPAEGATEGEQRLRRAVRRLVVLTAAAMLVLFYALVSRTRWDAGSYLGFSVSVLHLMLTTCVALYGDCLARGVAGARLRYMHRSVAVLIVVSVVINLALTIAVYGAPSPRFPAPPYAVATGFSAAGSAAGPCLITCADRSIELASQVPASMPIVVWSPPMSAWEKFCAQVNSSISSFGRAYFPIFYLAVALVLSWDLRVLTVLLRQRRAL